MEDQVLSIIQVQELQELGFDVEKYASIVWLEKTPFIPIEQPKEYELEILTDSLIGNRGNLDVIPTMTVGDIIKILPKEIEEKILHIFAFGKTWSVGWEGIQYYGSNTLIDALFETLKWCIKQKHIEL